MSRTQLCTVMIAVSLVVAGGCHRNAPYHSSTDALRFAPAADHKTYDLAFLEFSERGNLFNRDILTKLLDSIDQTAQPTAVFVFAHGWFHNAAEDDKNVGSFQEFLATMANGPFKATHRVIGVYIGWRGKTWGLVSPLGTFWARKAVAEEVGRGGVTEVLLRLQKLSFVERDSSGMPKDPTKKPNRLFILGHSFGGGAVLSALADIFLERLVNAEPVDVGECNDGEGDKDGRYASNRGAPCGVARPFADAVVLLNPAIEANQLLPLKELIAESRFPDRQQTLMHVLSSEGDIPTHYGFPVGQWLANLGWSSASLHREGKYRDEPVGYSIVLSERKLTQKTVGNYAGFRTGRMVGGKYEYARCWVRNAPSSGVGEWSKEAKLCDDSDAPSRLPSGANEPLQLVYSSAEFIKNHNDVLNCAVRAYILAIADEVQETARDPSVRGGGLFTKFFEERLGQSDEPGCKASDNCRASGGKWSQDKTCVLPPPLAEPESVQTPAGAAGRAR